MKAGPLILRRTVAALLAGGACGAAIKYLFAPGEAIPVARQADPAPRVVKDGAPGSGQQVTAAARLREIEHLDVRDYPLYSKAWLSAFAEAAKRAIEEDPAAAAEAFLRSSKLQKVASVEVFTDLLSVADPLVAMDFSARLPK